MIVQSSKLRPSFKGGSPLAMEQKNMLKKSTRSKKNRKNPQLVFEEEKNGNGLLDENQLK